MLQYECLIGMTVASVVPLFLSVVKLYREMHLKIQNQKARTNADQF